MTAVASTLQSFFTDRLARHRQASPHTIAAYRDTLRLLLRFLQQRTGIAPSRLDWADLDADTICAFLDHLESDRGNSARTRNARLTAIRSLFAYAALRHPEHAALTARVLAIPAKRFDKATVTFLDDHEVSALLRRACYDCLNACRGGAPGHRVQQPHPFAIKNGRRARTVQGAREWVLDRHRMFRPIAVESIVTISWSLAAAMPAAQRR